MYDVIIIGAGVTGSAVARELSRYKLNVCVLDKEEDVCCGTSKANSAIVHAGFDAAAGSLMARFNVRGNEMMDDISRDLDVPFKRNGAMVVCINESEKDGLQDLYDRGIANGVKGMQILTREEALEKEKQERLQKCLTILRDKGGAVSRKQLTEILVKVLDRKRPTVATYISEWLKDKTIFEDSNGQIQASEEFALAF